MKSGEEISNTTYSTRIGERKRKRAEPEGLDLSFYQSKRQKKEKRREGRKRSYDTAN